jgi:hypothetical protein
MRERDRPTASERGVSSTLSYVLSLAIATLLITGLIIAGTGFVTTQRDLVIREEMEVIGQHLASNVEQADRMANASEGSGTTVQVNQTLPDTAARSEYDVRLSESREQLVLNSSSPEQTVRVNISTTTDLGESTADGGAIAIRYDESSDELVIIDA